MSYLNYKKEIHDYLNNHKDEIINTLIELAKIPSVKGEKEENAPFGKPCAKILTEIKKLYDENNFNSEIDNEGGYIVANFGESEKTLGLFSHGDVVPVSVDWVLTKPFEPIIKDGYLIGRGVIDDKCAILTALYCAKMIKELNIPFNSKLIMFTGVNEETGMGDIKNYLTKHKAPDFSIVADSSFPLCRGNKGVFVFNAELNENLDYIKSISGSNVKGSILGSAKITLDYNENLFASLKESENVIIKREEDEIIIEATGISKHTAWPEGSINAGALAFSVLADSEYFDIKNREKFKFIKELLSDIYGRIIGVDNLDPDFGNLTFANDIIEYKNNKLNLHFNLRFGANLNAEELKKKVFEFFTERNYKVTTEREDIAKITDINHPLLQASLEVYKEFTGEKDAEASVGASGTYARHLENAIEIGLSLKGGYPEGMPKGHGNLHQSDECMHIEGYLEAIELTLSMLLKCDETE